MKTRYIPRWSIVWTAVLASLLMLSTVHGEDARPLRVLCYNIHYGQGNDGVYDLQRLADVINEANPDLVALQEVDVGVTRSGRVHQVRQLATLTGLSGRYGPTQHFQGGLYGNAVLTRLPILDVHIQPLPYSESTPGRTTYPRGAIAVTVETPQGTPLRFINTHFQHNVSEDRIAEAKAINSLFAQSAMPSILAGDLNATPGSEPIKIIERKWHSTLAPDREPAPTSPSKTPKSRIDYVFFRGSELKTIRSEVLSEPMASDHLPVLAVLGVTPSP